MDSNSIDSIEITVLLEDCSGYGNSLLSQHGTAFLVRARQGNVTKNILFDVGQNPETLLDNLKRLEIPLSSIDMIVLSHSHRDHTRGISKIVSRIEEEKQRVNREREEVELGNLPVIAHPDLFQPAFITEPHLRHYGIVQEDARQNIESAGGTLLLSKDPLELMPGIMITGEVKRQTRYEEESSLKLFTLKDGQLETNKVPEEIALAARVRNKGLVILTGCGHPGIINIVRHSMAITGEEKIEGIAGGLHLIDATDARIQATVEEVSKLKIGWIAAGHCTGFRAQTELFRAFRGRFGPLRTGVILKVPGNNFHAQGDLLFVGGIKF